MSQMLDQRLDHRVAILLSTFNGERYLTEQLDSLLQQTHEHWVLYWRDDGSSDATREVVADFTRRAGQGRCVEVPSATPHLGVTSSFHTLLGAVAGQLEAAAAVAFAGQDDVWLPNKLERGMALLATVPQAMSAMYCARQVLVDAELRPIGMSAPPTGPDSFASALAQNVATALAQNVATACTVMLNRNAAMLVAASTPEAATLHDWWCYLVVTGADGRLLHDPEPVNLYRQHGGNLVGAPASMRSRAVAALRRGPGVFMPVMRQHVAALTGQQHLLSDQARREVATLDAGLRGGLLRRIAALRIHGLQRQTWIETMVFRCWFILG